MVSTWGEICPEARAEVRAVEVSSGKDAPLLATTSANQVLRSSRRFLNQFRSAATRIISRERQKDLAVLAVLLLCSIILFKDALFDGKVFQEFDTTTYYYPIMQRFDIALLGGNLPLWTPYIFGGFPLYADGESGLFYPLNLLALLLLDSAGAFSLLRVLHFFLAAAFMYYFGRTLGLGRTGSAIGALTFAFGSFLVVQMHHANVVSSAIWAPLVLLFTERWLRSPRGTRHLNLLGAGVALGLASLGIHVQAVLMILLIYGSYVFYRLIVGPVALSEDSILRSSPFTSLPSSRVAATRARLHLWFRRHFLRRLGLLAIGATLTPVVGFGLAAIQLIPLYELSLYSWRSGPVGYQFSTSYNNTPFDLLDLLLPYLLRASDRRWWSLWAEWETTVYIGLVSLLLAGIGVFLLRSRQTFYFALLGVLGLFLSFGQYAPFQLHWWLSQLPGFSVLRAPGRFSFLFVFAGATLAAYGANWLATRLKLRQPRAFSRGLALYLVATGILALSFLWGIGYLHDLIQAHPSEVKDWIQNNYLSLNTGRPGVAPSILYETLLFQLDLLGNRTQFAALFLLATPLLLALWAWLRRPAWVWRGALVSLVAADLLIFGLDFHPMIEIKELNGSPEIVNFLREHNGLYRVYLNSYEKDVVPNRLLPYRISTPSGYSSLQTRRNYEYLSLVERADNTLLDLAGIRYLILPKNPPPLPSFQRTAYDRRRPVASGSRENANSRAVFKVPSFTATSVRILSAIEAGPEIPQGAPVAEIDVWDENNQMERLWLRAGTDVAEWDYDRPQIRGVIQHSKAQPAYQIDREDPTTGAMIDGSMFYAELHLPRPMTVQKVRFRYVEGRGRITVQGLALYNESDGTDYQLRSLTKEKYRPVFENKDVWIYENTQYFPKAFLVSSAIIRQPGRPNLSYMVDDAFDPSTTVLIEPSEEVPPNPAASPQLSQVNSPPRAADTPSRLLATVTEYSAMHVVVETQASTDAFLVLTDSYYPGWRAYVDGVEAPIYRGDYLFRAVPLPPGAHTVEFEYDPFSLKIGAGVSALTLLIVLGTTLVATWQACRSQYPS